MCLERVRRCARPSPRLCLAPVPLQVAITAVHLTRTFMPADWVSVLLAIQVLMLWMKMQYFSRCD